MITKPVLLALARSLLLFLYPLGTALAAISLVLEPRCITPAGWVRPLSVEIARGLALLALSLGWALWTQGEHVRWARRGFLWLVPLGVLSAVLSLLLWACSMVD